MKCNKKFTGLFAAAILATGFLTGCGSDEPKEETPSQQVDAESGASLSDQATDLIAHLSANGGWIFAATGNIAVDGELVIEGEFHDKDNTDKDLKRKLALYTQDDDRNVEDEFTLTVERIIVKSPNTTIQHGTVVGDIYVEAEGFDLTGTTVEGDVIFASADLMNAFVLGEGAEITGEMRLGEDAVAGASLSDQPSDFVDHLSANGGWIFAATADITITETVTVSGEFHDKNDPANDLRRKIALYTQDSERNVEDEFTLTVPELIIQSPATVIQHGTVVGDIVVEANNFSLVGVKIEGNVTFASEEYQASADLSDAEITGEVAVK